MVQALIGLYDRCLMPLQGLWDFARVISKFAWALSTFSGFCNLLHFAGLHTPSSRAENAK